MAREPKRCAWAAGKPDFYVAYHDEEWGVPLHDDRALFELLILEGAQAGLSWQTILARRDGYRRAFEGFDAARIARFTAARIAKLLAYPGIIRNRLKVEGAVKNARAFQRLLEEQSFDAYVWSFVGGRPIVQGRRSLAEIPASTPESGALSKDLRRRGFTFVGGTIVYAFMQAAGLVNDHEVSCFRHRACSRLS
ncbi:MAG: DNA-3-methyladenine glycosylase I [Acidobacteriota bacterium]